MQETSRLEAFNTLLEQSGVDKDVYADFVDPTFELLHQLASLVAEDRGAEAEQLLLQRFNEHEVGNAVIMHFRVSLSAPPQHVHVPVVSVECGNEASQSKDRITSSSCYLSSTVLPASSVHLHSHSVHLIISKSATHGTPTT